MRRREFITLLGGAAAVGWPLAAGAQQAERMRRIGVLLPAASGDPVSQAWVGAFLPGLALSGWTLGIAPGVERAAVFRDPSQGRATRQFAALQAVAPSLRMEVTPVNMRDAGEIEHTIVAFAGSPNAGLIMTSGPSARLHRDLIIKLAARHKLPAIYTERSFVAAGGLVSYVTDYIDQYRQAASYVDRILKGQKPAALPVQAPTKYELVINLKTAKALGIEIPPTVLA